MKPVWDFGGVVFGWQPERLLRRALPRRVTDDASAAHWKRQVFQDYGGDWAAFDRGTVTVPALVERIAARTGLGADEVQAVVDGVADELQPLPETVALIAELHAAGATQFYLSNMPAPYADRLEAAHGVFACFADGVFSARVRAIKPEPAIFDLAARRFGVPPDELLFFDDHEPNVLAARAAGWRAEVFAGAGAAREVLARHRLLVAVP